jgi:hypothetical protein
VGVGSRLPATAAAMPTMVATPAPITAPVAAITVVVTAVVRMGRDYHRRTWIVVVRASVIWANRRIITVAITSIIAGSYGGHAAAQ